MASWFWTVLAGDLRQMDGTAAPAVCYDDRATMKRLSAAIGLVSMLGGGLSACAEAEEISPDVLRGAEDYYFTLQGGQNPNPNPTQGTPPAEPSATGIPPAPSAFAPALPGGETPDDAAPPNSIPLQLWLEQQAQQK